MFKTVRFLLFLLISLSTTAHSKKLEERNNTEDLTIIVSSCDKYADCWKPFCQLLFKYWPFLKDQKRKIEIVLITNKKEFSYPGITVYKTGEDKSWSDNLLEALKTIKSKYVLYLQEDYFLSSPLDERRLGYLFTEMKKHNIPYIEIGPDSFFNKEKDYPLVKGTVIKGKHIPYRTSLQPALWEKKVLEHLLKQKETAWTFEVAGSTRSEGLMEPFLAVKNDHPIHFFNACGSGYFSKKALEFLKKEGIALKSVSLPIDEDYPFTLWLRDFSNRASIRRLKLYFLWTKFLGLWDPKFA